MDTNKMLNKLLEGQQKIEEKLSSIKNEVTSIKSQQKENTKKIDTIFEQTGKLTVGQTDIYNKLENISENIEFLTTKEAVNEREIFKVKKKIK